MAGGGKAKSVKAVSTAMTIFLMFSVLPLARLACFGLVEYGKGVACVAIRCRGC